MNAWWKSGWLWLGRAAFLSLALSGFAAAQGNHTYMIAPGDTVETIAKTFETSVSELVQMNGLTSSTLFAGQPLRVPGVQAGVVEHRAVGGDTLQFLAAAYRLPEATLRRANPDLGDVPAAAQIVVDTPVFIPPGDGEVVVLGVGEHVLDVALRYGLSVSEFSKLNALGDLRGVTAGRRLFVPAAATNTASAAPTRPETQQATQQDTRATHLARQKTLLAGAERLLAAYEPAATSFRWPLRGRISSGYGRRNISVGGNTFHGGVDVAAPQGTAVGAARPGVVSRAGWGGAYGYVVFVEHQGGAQTRYGHLSQIATSVGTVLEQGDTLGLVGSTGASTGPHLHFEIRFDGRTVDPLGYLQ
ncbi:M23 family metallopeptidase [soil metagenome]